MNADELFRAGKLKEAIQRLGDEIRQDPLDARKRTFLFELLCFAGEWERAEKQLQAIAQGGPNTELGKMLYRAALYAEQARREFFRNKAFVSADPPSPAAAEGAILSGVCNGRAFQGIADADARIGSRLEVFVAGRYLWVPFEHIVSLEIAPPKRLRDLLWAPALITNGPNFKGRDLGEVMLPVLCPFSSGHEDDAVKLGRATVWQEEDDTEVPFGQKLLLIGGEEVPLLEIRTLQFDARESAVAEA